MELEKKTVSLGLFNFPLRMAAYTVIVLLMGNVNAIVDRFEHPHIPYFDPEHLMVGAVTGIISLILIALLEVYLSRLNRALRKIRLLESYLAICANCGKVRIPHADPKDRQSWLPLEYYITENTDTVFSHGICPDCLEKYRTDLEKRNPTSNG